MEIKRPIVLSLTALLACSSAAIAGLRFNVEQEKAPVARSVQTSPNSFLGVELGDVSRQTVERLKLREERGALIEGITSGSSAAQAGLQKDDVIIKWDGDPIESARELSRHIRETPAGRKVRLGVFRDGREIEIAVTLGERSAISIRPRIVGTTPSASAEIRAQAARAREETRAATARLRGEARTLAARARDEARVARAGLRELSLSTGRLGVQVQSMTPQLAEYFGLSKRTGSLVVFVYADSPAAKAGLKAGDVILSAGGHTVENPMDLRTVLNDKSEGPLEMRILRDKQEQNVTVQLEKGRGSLLVESDDCADSAVRAMISPLRIHVPRVALAPLTVQVPQVSTTPVEINVPGVTIAPIAIPAVKVDLKPLKFSVPKIKIDPVNIVVLPKRVVL